MYKSKRKTLLVIFSILLITLLPIQAFCAEANYPIIANTYGFYVPSKGYVYIGMGREYAHNVLGSPKTTATDLVDGTRYYEHFSYDGQEVILHYNNNNVTIGMTSKVKGTAYNGYVVGESSETKLSDYENFNDKSALLSYYMSKALPFILLDASTGTAYVTSPAGSVTYEQTTSKGTSAVSIGI